MSDSKKIKVAIVINNIEGKENLLQQTMENLNGLTKNSDVDLKIIIAQCTDFVKDYNEIQRFICKNESEIYYRLPKNVDDVDYIAFINAGDTYSNNILNKISYYITNFPKRNIYVTSIQYENMKNTYQLNSTRKKEAEVVLEKHTKKIWTNLESCFISREILLNLVEPNYLLKHDTNKDVLFQLLLLSGQFVLVKKCLYRPVEPLEDVIIGKQYIYDIDWYRDILIYWDRIFKKLKEQYNYIPEYFQNCFLYELNLRINVNVNTNDKHILVNEKYEEFIKNVKKILQNIDDDIIMQDPTSVCKINPQLKFWLLRLKYNKENDELEYREYKNEVTLTFNNKKIFNASEKKLAIYLMDNEKDKLLLSGIYAFPFDTQKMRIYAEYAGKKYYAKTVQRYSDYRVFGKVIYRNYAYDIEVPLSLPDYKNELRFYLETDKSTVNLELTFSKPMSKLSNEKESYWCFRRYIIYHRSQRLMVLKKRKKRLINKEITYLKKLRKSKNKVENQAAKLRMIYFITKPFFRGKKIWIFFDKMYKAGDNAEYLYRYSINQKDKYDKYYILRDDVPDAKRLKKDGIKFVKYNSLKHKLLFLNAQTILATHCNVSTFNTFNKDIEKHFRGLFKYDVVCIAHGLTVQSIPHNQNRIVDNTKLYPVPTYIEKENIDNELYDYKDKNIVKLAGMCRYDGLKNNDKKQILITPTWRTYLAIPSETGKARGYNSVFKETDYFKIYNRLINNEKLIEKARQTGYEIIYLLHPVVSSQIDDFDKNEYVKIVAATDDLNYEKILTESSLMVTDYSGIQFDFAYMYKPVVYFHPDELPASYDEGAYKYETMSLGEIIKHEDKLVDTLCEYMENGCKIKDEYKERIDNFFVFHDYNNCERIYNEIINYRKKRR